MSCFCHNSGPSPKESSLFGHPRLNVVKVHEVVRSVGGAPNESDTMFSVIFVVWFTHVGVLLRVGRFRVAVNVVPSELLTGLYMLFSFNYLLLVCVWGPVGGSSFVVVEVLCSAGVVLCV